MLETTQDANYSTRGIQETTLVDNYSTGGMLETTQDTNYSTVGMLETTQDAITPPEGCWKPLRRTPLRMLITASEGR